MFVEDLEDEDLNGEDDELKHYIDLLIYVCLSLYNIYSSFELTYSFYTRNWKSSRRNDKFIKKKNFCFTS